MGYAYRFFSDEFNAGFQAEEVILIETGNWPKPIKIHTSPRSSHDFCFREHQTVKIPLWNLSYVVQPWLLLIHVRGRSSVRTRRSRRRCPTPSCWTSWSGCPSVTFRGVGCKAWRALVADDPAFARAGGAAAAGDGRGLAVQPLLWPVPQAVPGRARPARVPDQVRIILDKFVYFFKKNYTRKISRKNNIRKTV